MKLRHFVNAIQPFKINIELQIAPHCNLESRLTRCIRMNTLKYVLSVKLHLELYVE